MPFDFQSLKTKSKSGFDKAWAASEKYIGQPLNNVASKLGIENVWPMDLGSETDKAARILRVFTIDRDHAPEKLNVIDPHAAKKQQAVLQRIPAEAIKQAQGIAIFTVFRSGLGVSGASGGGVVLARKEDGSWSGPSGLLIHTIGFGFLVGVDVYDCVLLLRTKQAVESFSNPKVNLGVDLSLVAGPVGQAAVIDAGYKQTPAWSYVKSKGFYAGAQLDGSIIIERQDENAKFYHGKYTAKEILAGKTRVPHEALGLINTIKAAEGKAADTSLIPKGEAPSEVPHLIGTQPPNYDDLDVINVKCSMCAAEMTPDMLTMHKCEATVVGDPSAPPPNLPPRTRAAAVASAGSSNAGPTTEQASTIRANNNASDDDKIELIDATV